MNNEDFYSYYENYLGLDNNIDCSDYKLCISKLRDEPINKRFYYSVIITKYRGDKILSVSNDKRNIYVPKIENSLKYNDIDDIYKDIKLNNPTLLVRKMYRMKLVNFNEFDIIYTDGYDYCYLEKLNKFVAKYLVIYDDKVVSYSKISDVNFNHGNIVIWTDESSRKQGFATTLLVLLLKKCAEIGIEPVYLVDSSNIPSFNLAKKVGFEIISTEIIISDKQ